MRTLFKDMSDDALLNIYQKLSPKELLKQSTTGNAKVRRLALIALFRQSSDEAMHHHRQLLSQWILEPNPLMPPDRDIESAIALPNATCIIEGLMVIGNRKKSQKEKQVSSSSSSPTSTDKTYFDLAVKRLKSPDSTERLNTLNYLIKHPDFLSLTQSQVSILSHILPMLFSQHKKEQKTAFMAINALIPNLSREQHQHILSMLFSQHKKDQKAVSTVVNALAPYLTPKQRQFILEQVLQKNVIHDYLRTREIIGALSPHFHTAERTLILNWLLSKLKNMDRRYFPRSLAEAAPPGFENDLKQIAFFISLLKSPQITILLNELSSNNEEMSSIRPYVVACIKKRHYLLPILNEVLTSVSLKSPKIDKWPLNILNKLVPYFTPEEQNTIILPCVLLLLSDSEQPFMTRSTLLEVLTRLDLNFATTEQLYEVVQKVLEKNEYFTGLKRPMKMLLEKLTPEQIQLVLDQVYQKLSMQDGDIQSIQVSLMVLNILDTEKYPDLLNKVLLMLQNDSLLRIRQDLLIMLDKLASKTQTVGLLQITIDSVALMANSRRNASFATEIAEVIESLALRLCDLAIEEKELLPLFSSLVSLKMISPVTYKSLLYLLEYDAIQDPDTYSKIIQHMGQLINTPGDGSGSAGNLMNMWLIKLAQMTISPEEKIKLLQPIIELSQQLNAEHEKTPQTELLLTTIQTYLDIYFDLRSNEYHNSVDQASSSRTSPS